jgi:glutamate mutase epsilon subunit
MANLTNDQKAKIYDQLLFKYQKIQEEVRQLKSKNFEISLEDQKKVTSLESQMRQIYSETNKLYL